MRNLRCLLLLGLWSMAVAQSCPQPYVRFANNHTFCLPPNETCDLLPRNDVSAAEIAEIIEVHNNLRRNVAKGNTPGRSGNLPPAADMLEMQWDDELADLAQKHADQCVDDHDCKPCRQLEDFKVGQNLHSDSSPSTSPIAAINWTSIVQGWYDESKLFDSDNVGRFGSSTYSSDSKVGHFTQVAWARSWRVGCGNAAFTDSGYTYQLYVCNYGPMGNIQGEPVYQEGSTCSNCPGNTICNDGLCQVQIDRIPAYPVENNRYYCNFTNLKACAIINNNTRPWTVTNTLSGSYFGIVLKESEESNFTISKTFRGSSCIYIYFRKGSNVQGEKSRSEFVFLIPIPRTRYKYIERKQLPDSPDFKKYTIDSGPGVRNPRIAFRVTRGTAYVEISKIVVVGTKC